MNNYCKFTNYQPVRYDHLKISPRNKNPIVEQVNDYLDFCGNIKKLSRMTMHGKECAARFFIVETHCDAIEHLDNDAYNLFVRKELQRGVSPGTINTRSAHIVTMAKFFKEMGYDVPLKTPLIFKLKEHPAKRVSYTADEIEEVLKVANNLEWLLIKIGFDTGMRLSEITNLTVEQVTGRRIDFIGKGDMEREVYLTPECAERLQEYIEDHEIRSGRIWLNEWGYPHGSDTLRQIMKRPFFAKGYTDFHPHALRHSFGSDIQKRGADVMVIKEMMGHANLSTTQRYLHALDGQMQMMFDTYRG